MRKLFAILIVFLFFYSTSLAQDKLLVAEGTSPNLYITHTVTPKENYYSVGRMYNVSPKELAPYNDLTFEKGFLLGQTIKIPLGPNNFSQGDAPKENEVLVPVYHIMKAKEEKPIVKEKPADDVTVKTSGTINFNGGKFKGLYNDQSKNRTSENEFGVAAIFKTTSGWQDGKYYCFHNTAEPGTIIKVTNNANGKSVYAKVLDAIPDIKQNSGLLLRISNSAADELGVSENKFDCSITYAK